MTKPTSNQLPFLMRRHYRHAVAALRSPLLSIGAPETVQFACWERGERMMAKLARRWSPIELARLSDGDVFDYVTSRFLHVTDQGHGTVVGKLTLSIDEIVKDLRLGAFAGVSVIDAFRRLTNTLVTLETRKGPRYPEAFPLLEITRRADGLFEVILSAWMEDEVMHARFAPARSHELTLHGIRHRLDGWMRGRVGPERDEGRIIRRSEALDRIGPLPGVAAGERWTAICAIVEANDLHDFEMSLCADRDEPAIYIRPRRPEDHERPDADNDHTSAGSREIPLEWPDETEAQGDDTNGPPRSISL